MDTSHAGAIVAVYLDNLLSVESNIQVLEAFVSVFRKRFYVKDATEVTKVLGIEIIDLEDESKEDHKQMIAQLAEYVNVKNCCPENTFFSLKRVFSYTFPWKNYQFPRAA